MLFNEPRTWREYSPADWRNYVAAITIGVNSVEYFLDANTQPALRIWCDTGLLVIYHPREHEWQYLGSGKPFDRDDPTRRLTSDGREQVLEIHQFCPREDQQREIRLWDARRTMREWVRDSGVMDEVLFQDWKTRSAQDWNRYFSWLTDFSDDVELRFHGEEPPTVHRWYDSVITWDSTASRWCWPGSGEPVTLDRLTYRLRPARTGEESAPASVQTTQNEKFSDHIRMRREGDQPVIGDVEEFISRALSQFRVGW